MPNVGDIVMRGPDWNWGDQDTQADRECMATEVREALQLERGMGILVLDTHSRLPHQVLWAAGRINSYGTDDIKTVWTFKEWREKVRSAHQEYTPMVDCLGHLISSEAQGSNIWTYLSYVLEVNKAIKYLSPRRYLVVPTAKEPNGAIFSFDTAHDFFRRLV